MIYVLRSLCKILYNKYKQLSNIVLITVGNIIQSKFYFYYSIGPLLYVYCRGLLLAGHSAGAHLIASLFQDDYFIRLPEAEQSLVKAAFLIGGIYNLIPLINFPSINDPLKLTKQEAERLSPLIQKISASDGVKFYIAVAEHESPAFKEQAKELYEKLQKSRHQVEFVDVDNTDHFDIIEKLTEEDFLITKIIFEFN